MNFQPQIFSDKINMNKNMAVYIPFRVGWVDNLRLCFSLGISSVLAKGIEECKLELTTQYKDYKQYSIKKAIT